MKSVVLVFSAIDRTFPRIPLQVVALVFFTTLLLATLVVPPVMAQAPGSTRVMIRNPDVGKWAGSRNFFSTSSSEFVCRPLGLSRALQGHGAHLGQPDTKSRPSGIGEICQPDHPGGG
jgi:hypothetical protein